MRALVLPALLMLFSIFSRAQTGPGGVGNSSSVKVWLDASHIDGLSNGAPVGRWADRSGEWDAVQPDTLNMPRYFTNQLNGNPIVRFDRTLTPQYLEISYEGVGASMTGSNSIFVVSKPTLGSTVSDYPEGNQLVFGAGLGKLQGIYYSGYPQMDRIINMQRLNGTGLTATAHVYCAYAKSNYTWQRNVQISERLAATMIFTAYQNMTRKATNPPAKQMSNYTGLNSFKVGAYAETGTMAAFHGDISEIIFYSAALNRTQVLIVDNYLAAKYGLPRAGFYNSISYTRDLQGIGTYDGTANNKHSVARASKGLCLEELNGSMIGANTFLFSAHASIDNNIVTSDLGEHISSRWKRSWFVQKTGQIDAALSFDFAESGLTPPLNLALEKHKYRILYRASLDEPFDALEITASFRSANELIFEVNDAELSTGYYTLGYVDNPEIVWTGNANQNWNDPGNWSANRVPVAEDKVRVDNCATCPKLNGDVVIASLTMTFGSLLQMIDHDLTVQGSSSLEGAQVTCNQSIFTSIDFTQLKDCSFSGSITLKKSGGGENYCDGGNRFEPSVRFLNLSTSNWHLAGLSNSEISDQ